MNQLNVIRRDFHHRTFRMPGTEYHAKSRLLVGDKFMYRRAMECFVTPQGLLINELAPRVHNSGHWTQNGASISQFELHLRAITDLPLPQPVVNSPSVMINLIGSDVNYDWLKLPLVHLHWYDKEVRPGRKVGHLNLTDSDTSRLTATLEALIPLLPPEYASGVIWAQSKFS